MRIANITLFLSLVVEKKPLLCAESATENPTTPQET